MRRTWTMRMLLGVLAAVGACAPASVERSPFLGYTEEYGVAGQQQGSDSDGSGGGAATQDIFRRDMTLTLRNNYAGAEVNCAFIAWVGLNSVRNADQQDALLRAGYSQLTREERIGSAIVLPVGTFVYDGGGTAGATAIVLGRAASAGSEEGGEATPETLAFTLPTPDGLLVFAQPPVSCDTVAFYFTDDGEPLTGSSNVFTGATQFGGYKTIAQVSAYQCSPFKPGLYFSSGGVRAANQYLEGESVTFDFILFPDENGDAAIVTIGEVPAPITQTTDQNTGDGDQTGGEDEGGTP